MLLQTLLIAKTTFKSNFNDDNRHDKSADINISQITFYKQFT